MSIDTILDTNAIVNHYVLANTPGFLYRHLKTEPSVARLAESVSTAKLMEIVNECENKKERSTVDVAIAYAALTAMDFQDYQSVRNAILTWQPKALAWGKYFSSRLAQPKIHNNVISFTPYKNSFDQHVGSIENDSTIYLVRAFK